MFDKKNVVLLAPYGSMKFTKLSAKIGIPSPPPPAPAPSPGDGKTLLNF